MSLLGCTTTKKCLFLRRPTSYGEECHAFKLSVASFGFLSSHKRFCQEGKAQKLPCLLVRRNQGLFHNGKLNMKKKMPLWNSVAAGDGFSK